MLSPIIIKPDSIKKTGFNYLYQYLKSNRDEIMAQLNIYGAVLFRDYDLKGINNFEMLAQAITPFLIDYRGGDSPRTKLLNNIYTSTEYAAHQTIQLHNEKSFSAHYPKYIYFYCEKPATIGGNTLLAYNQILLEHLDDAIIAEYERKKIKYTMHLHMG